MSRRGREPSARSPRPASTAPRPDPTFPPGHLVVGRVLRAHGLRGEVALRSYTGDPAAVASYGPLITPEGRSVTIARMRPAKDGFVAVLEGITNREGAEALAGRDLAVPRSRLPEPEDDEFFHADLVGLDVRDGGDRVLGRVEGVAEFGAGDLLDIALRPGGRRAYLPFTREFVPRVDLAGGYVVVAPPLGAFPDDEDTADGVPGDPPTKGDDPAR